LLTEHLSWRWVFLINLPVGLLAWKCRGAPWSGRWQDGGADRLPGTLLMIARLGSLLLALPRSARTPAWKIPSLLRLFAGRCSLLLLFVWHERRTGRPCADALFAIGIHLSWLVGFFASFQSISCRC
jgi:hypothetical protein